MAEHCVNNAGDRAVGARWEMNFCRLLLNTFGVTLSANQIKREASAVAVYKEEDGTYKRLILPDVVIWTTPTQHHEIKHKSPTKSGLFGLERYRFDSLLHFKRIVQQPVFYTIHNHDLSGGVNSDKNKLEHWFSAEIDSLAGAWKYESMGDTWCNGIKKQTALYYWNQSLFIPLGDIFQPSVRMIPFNRQPPCNHSSSIKSNGPPR